MIDAKRLVMCRRVASTDDARFTGEAVLELLDEIERLRLKADRWDELVAGIGMRLNGETFPCNHVSFSAHIVDRTEEFQSSKEKQC